MCLTKQNCTIIFPTRCCGTTFFPCRAVCASGCSTPGSACAPWANCKNGASTTKTTPPARSGGRRCRPVFGRTFDLSCCPVHGRAKTAKRQNAPGQTARVLLPAKPKTKEKDCETDVLQSFCNIYNLFAIFFRPNFAKSK